MLIPRFGAYRLRRTPIAAWLATALARTGETAGGRGDGFARVVGAFADIGAYELDTREVIFTSGFDR